MAYRGLTIIFASFLIFLGQFGYSSGKCTGGQCLSSGLGSSQYLRGNTEACYNSSDTVQLTCDGEHVKPEGPSNNTCINGSWENGPTNCSVFCSPLKVDNLIQSPIKTTYEVGNKVTFSCNKGYKLTSGSPMSAHCLNTGHLNSTKDPECIVFCSPLNVSNLIQSPNKTTYEVGNKVTFSCNKGYKLTSGSPMSAHCLNTGHLNSTQECIAFNCSAPTNTTEYLNWTDKGKRKTYNGNETITYSCSEGLKLQGSENNTCTDQNKWKNKDPTCSSGNVVQVFWYFLLMTTFYSVFSFNM